MSSQSQVWKCQRKGSIRKGSSYLDPRRSWKATGCWRYGDSKHSCLSPRVIGGLETGEWRPTSFGRRTSIGNQSACRAKQGRPEDGKPPGAHLLEGQHQVAWLSLCDSSSTAMMARGGESRRIALYERGPLADILLLSTFFSLGYSYDPLGRPDQRPLQS